MLATLNIPHYAKSMVVEKKEENDLDKYSVKELWNKLNIQQKVEVIQQMGYGKDRREFFATLDSKEQHAILGYMALSDEEAKKKAINEYKETIELVCSYDLDCMMLISIMTGIYDRLKKKIAIQDVCKMPQFKFVLPKFVKLLNESMAKMRPWCIKKEGGIMTQLMTQALPYFWKQYECTGNFFFQLEGKYPGLMSKWTDRFYVTIRKYCDKWTVKHGDIAACALQLGVLAQLIGKNNDKCVSKLKVLRKDEETKARYKARSKQAREWGFVPPKWKEPYYPDAGASEDVAYACEKICVGIIGKDYMQDKNLQVVKKAYGEWKKKFEDEKLVDALLNTCIENTIKAYVWFYFAKMVSIVKQGIEMPNDVKGDINFLFQSSFGYCRMMKDIHKAARMIETDDEDDIMDILPDMVDKGELKTMGIAAERVILMRRDELVYNDDFVRRNYEKEYEKAKAEYLKAM